MEFCAGKGEGISLASFHLPSCLQLQRVHSGDVIRAWRLTLLLLETSLSKSVFCFILLLVDNQEAGPVVYKFVLDALVVFFVADEAGLVVARAGLEDDVFGLATFLQFGSVGVVSQFGLVSVG